MSQQEKVSVDSPTVQSLQSTRLSFYRTEHEFLHYGEFGSPEEFTFYKAWAGERRLRILILGSGSNVLFKHHRVRSLVLKNRLPRVIREIDPLTIEVSSSVMIAEILKWCEERDLDSFYYLASVPATVGGAIAMNAGRGQIYNKTIFDFVQSVTVHRSGQPVMLTKEQIPIGYRQTPFTGQKDELILSAVLRFQPTQIEGRPRHERVAWSKEHQDHSAPNCGSVFKQSDPRIMNRIRGRRFLSASYSGKTINWILNTGTKSWPIVCLVRITQLLHLAVGKRAVPEIIQVD